MTRRHRRRVEVNAGWYHTQGSPSSSWFGLFGPPIAARAGTGGPDKPNHDGKGRPHVSSQAENARTLCPAGTRKTSASVPSPNTVNIARAARYGIGPREQHGIRYLTLPGDPLSESYQFPVRRIGVDPGAFVHSGFSGPDGPAGTLVDADAGRAAGDRPGRGGDRPDRRRTRSSGSPRRRTIRCSRSSCSARRCCTTSSSR